MKRCASVEDEARPVSTQPQEAVERGAGKRAWFVAVGALLGGAGALIEALLQVVRALGS